VLERKRLYVAQVGRNTGTEQPNLCTDIIMYKNLSAERAVLDGADLITRIFHDNKGKGLYVTEVWEEFLA
jgi:hypothetical protein